MHFWNAEQLMERYGCRGLAEHRAEQQHLLAQLCKVHLIGLPYAEAARMSDGRGVFSL